MITWCMTDARLPSSVRWASSSAASCVSMPLAIAAEPPVLSVSSGFAYSPFSVAWP
ncbi:MAG: hypothetical protein LUQ06_06690 [Methylococcaceae bacterium]|nr:hypothetical protein [Methylococcaceae bacterium]